MANKKYFSLIFISLTFWISGCAMTVEKVALDYTPPSIITDNAKSTVFVTHIADERTVASPNMILHKKNQYGNTMSGGYEAEKPLTEIIKDSLQAAFLQTNDSKYSLNGTLEDFTYEAISGWWSSKLKSKLIIKLNMKDKDTNKIVWNDTIIARGNVDEFSGSDDAVRKLVSTALDDLLKKLRNSESLNQHLIQ